ncbi:MAG TPA: hypothetical protein DIT07_14395 [Sphingobacteriaceae bacterium]|nr:hypothetical protein [Sphingobacteriaceae bacterium]
MKNKPKNIFTLISGFFLIGFFLSVNSPAQSFEASQQNCEHVKTAYLEKWDRLKSEMQKQGINAAVLCISL